MTSCCEDGDVLPRRSASSLSISKTSNITRNIATASQQTTRTEETTTLLLRLLSKLKKWLPNTESYILFVGGVFTGLGFSLTFIIVASATVNQSNMLLPVDLSEKNDVSEPTNRV